jgi:hypothetical protein
MSESLFQFFREQPFWAVLIVVFMVLPMIGAVLHIVLKALGRKGIDNSPPVGTAQMLRGEKATGAGNGSDRSITSRADDDSGDPGHPRPDSGS